MGYLLWHYVAENARRYPSNLAIVSRDNRLTYGELHEHSDRLAARLAAEGIGSGHRVALYLPKSHKSVIAILGILKTGAAYVPVDPTAPGRRAGFILADCAVSGLVTTGQHLARLAEMPAALKSIRLILVTDDSTDERSPAIDFEGSIHGWDELESQGASAVPSPSAIETDPAYLLYTSGSTGNPKGVILSHRHAVNFVEWGAETFDVTPQDKLSNHAPLHFDLSIFDVFVALSRGACVSMIPDEVATFPLTLAEWIETNAISISYSVPSALTRLLLRGRLERFEYRALRTVLFAGEVFPVKYLREVMEKFKHADFFNLYGPTETNVCTFYKVPKPLDPDVAQISIGKACANTEVVALGEQGRPIEPGETGELYVRGPSVMLGYWGLEEKTQEVLVRNPLQSSYHEWLYRTGDIVQLEPDGNYSFLGRRDHMIKSRGYRIELGDIEQALYEHERVREAAVVAVPDEEIGARLHAFIVLHDHSKLNAADLESFCLTRLPRYMVPETFHLRGELPKTSTGKMDRVALGATLHSNSQ